MWNHVGRVIYNLLSECGNRGRDGHNYSEISTRAPRKGDGCPGKHQCRVRWQQVHVQGLMELMKQVLLLGSPLLMETIASQGRQ